MNPLLRRLAVLRLKVRFFEGWQGVCALITLVLTVGLTIGVLDFMFHLPTLVRAAVLVGLLVGAGGIVYRFLIRPFGKPCNDLNLALRVEEECPELNDALASTVQFLSQTKEEQARVGGSSEMRERTIQHAIDKAATVDFSRILDRRVAICFGLAAFAAISLAGFMSYAYSSYARIAFLRLAEPFGMHTWTEVAVYRTAPFEDDEWKQLAAKGAEPDHIAVGRPYVIKVALTGQIPLTARVEIDGKIRNDIRIDKDKLIRDEKEQTTYFIAPINMTQHYQEFKFRVLANDGAFPPRGWHTVQVLNKPKLIDLNGSPSPQIVIEPPAYTDLPKTPMLPGAKHMELLAGSKAVYRARADRELEEAYIRWMPEDSGLVDAVHALAGAAVAQRTYAVLDEKDKSIFTIPLRPWVSGSYVLYMRDKYKLETEEVADIRVVKDPVPIVRLIKPALSAEFTPEAKVPFLFNVTDDKFAVKNVWVEFRRKNANGEPDDDVTRTTIYDAKTQGKLIPLQLAKAMGLGGVPADLRLRQPKLNFETIWSLKKQFKEGDVIVVEICADDFCDIYATREPGRSQQIELRILSKRAIMQNVEEKLAKVQQDIQRAAKLEKQAINTVKQVAKEDKIDQNVKDKFNDAGAQPQQDVRDIIGKEATDGVRGELAKIRKTLRENQLENTQPFKEAGEIKGALDNIADGELTQLDPKLRQIASDLSHADKNTPATKKKLDEAAKLQQNVADTLNDLIRKMDPQAKGRDIRQEMRDLVTQQNKLREEQAQLNEDRDVYMKGLKTDDEKQRLDKDYKDRVAQKAEEQKDLANRLDKALKDMKAEQQRQENNVKKIDKQIDQLKQEKQQQLDMGNKQEAQKIDDELKQLQEEKAADKNEAEKLKQAVKQLEQPEPEKQKLNDPNPKDQPPPVAAQMKDVARDLKNKSETPQKDLQQQDKIAQQMEKALNTLEGKNPDMAREEIKNRKEAEKKIDDLAKELRQLREEEKQADMIKDMEERLKKKQEIAEKLANLQQKMQKTRRELAQLQEQAAADKLKGAADDLAKAAEKDQNGGDGQADEKEAQRKLADAKNDVKDSEEQLARELLIKMADELKAIKERQDASLKRSEDLHPKVLRIKSWSDALLDSLELNRDAQKDVADETDGLKDKLKEAVVFGGILERAKNFMDEAGKVMDTRQTEGKDRRYAIDGKKMDDAELKDEADWQDDTVRNQKQASKSLNNLLEALKEEIDKPKKPRPQEDPDKDPPKQEEPPKGGVPEQDGIPPKAQLKALKAEQLDLNERTKDFDMRNPDPTMYNARQREEVARLLAEQERLRDLFQRLINPRKEGDQP